MPPGQCITTWIWTWTCTVFHSISQNILSKCFVKYCTLISLKWQHCENFGLLPAMLAHWRIPTATMLTPGRGRLPGASLLRLRLLMMLTAASHCRQSLDGVRWCEIVRDPISILLYYVTPALPPWRRPLKLKLNIIWPFVWKWQGFEKPNVWKCRVLCSFYWTANFTICFMELSR